MSVGAEIMKDLKAAVLAIEWEISDEGMDTLIEEIGPLQTEWAGKKPLLVCLQLIRTLAQYIKKARERAHPDTIKLLHSIFATLETVVTDDSVSDKQGVGMIRSEVEKYNTLKVEIAKPRTDPAPPVREETSEGMGGVTMRSLMDQKEDKNVDGAFDTMFQGMVAGEVAPPARPAMPSSTPMMGADDKEVVSGRVEGEVFQEADDLLDDFFADDGGGLSFDDEEEATETIPEEEETIEVDLGKISPEEESPVEVAADASEDEEPEEIEVDNLERIIEGLVQDVSKSRAAELTAEVADLQNQHAAHSSLGLFLEVIASVGRHLTEYPDVASTASCELLQKIFDRLNHALFTMKPKQDILAGHLESMSDYGAWHEQIVAKIRESGAVAPEPMAAQEGEMSEELMTAVKDLVRREVDVMREELLEVMRENM